MDDNESLAHARWECKYHVVWIPKYRRKALYGELRKHLGPVLRELARQRECVVEEGHFDFDHVHMLLSIPPKYAAAQVLGFIKGKRAIHIAGTYLGRGSTSRANTFRRAAIREAHIHPGRKTEIRRSCADGGRAYPREICPRGGERIS